MTSKIKLLYKCVSQCNFVIDCFYSRLKFNETDNRNLAKLMIGTYYVILNDCKELINSLKEMHKICTLNKRTKNNIETIEFYLYECSPFIFDLSPDIRGIMQEVPKMEQAKLKGFRDVFKAKFAKIVNGEMVEMTADELQESDENSYFSNLELASTEIEWTEDMRNFEREFKDGAKLKTLLKYL